MIDDEVGSAAYHIPEGMLLAYDPRLPGGRREHVQVSTTRIAPTLLALQGIAPPAYMDRPIQQLLESELEAA